MQVRPLVPSAKTAVIGSIHLMAFLFLQNLTIHVQVEKFHHFVPMALVDSEWISLSKRPLRSFHELKGSFNIRALLRGRQRVPADTQTDRHALRSTRLAVSDENVVPFSNSTVDANVDWL